MAGFAPPGSPPPVNPQFDPLGSPPPPQGPYPFQVTYPTPGIPPAVAARQRQDAKKDEQRKFGRQLTSAIKAVSPSGAPAQPGQGAQRQTQTPAPQYPGVPQEDAPTTPVAQEQVPAFKAAEYKPPNRALEYLALGIGLLFPGAPIARMAAGLLGGLEQGAEKSYQRREGQAEQQYQVQSQQAQADARNQAAKRAAEIADAQRKAANQQVLYAQGQQYRAAGLDPTGKPIPLPPQLAAPMPRTAGNTDYFKRESALASFYSQMGAYDVAKEHQALAADYQRAAVSDATNARQILLEAQREAARWQQTLQTEHHQDLLHADTEAHADARHYSSEAAANARHADAMAVEGARLQREDIRLALEEGRAVQADATRRAVLRDQSLTAGADYSKLVGQLTMGKPLLDGNGAPRLDSVGQPMYGPATVSGPLKAVVAQLNKQIARSTNPAAFADALVNRTPNLTPQMREMILSYGRYQDLIRRSQGNPIMPPPPTAASGGQPKTKINPANGKTYYLHSDQNYYPTPP